MYESINENYKIDDFLVISMDIEHSNNSNFENKN